MKMLRNLKPLNRDIKKFIVAGMMFFISSIYDIFISYLCSKIIDVLFSFDIELIFIYFGIYFFIIVFVNNIIIYKIKLVLDKKINDSSIRGKNKKGIIGVRSEFSNNIITKIDVFKKSLMDIYAQNFSFKINI